MCLLSSFAIGLPAVSLHTDCVTQILNDILLISMNSQRFTFLALLDLSSAFDTIVDNRIFLERLRSKFGIRRKVLSWFSSYLSGRSQRVMLNGTLSDSSDLNFGIPQDSCLGPLIFILYMPPNCSILLTITSQIHMVLLMTLSCMCHSNLTTHAINVKRSR
jgi:hypothetical protein